MQVLSFVPNSESAYGYVIYIVFHSFFSSLSPPCLPEYCFARFAAAPMALLPPEAERLATVAAVPAAFEAAPIMLFSSDVIWKFESNSRDAAFALITVPFNVPFRAFLIVISLSRMRLLFSPIIPTMNVPPSVLVNSIFPVSNVFIPGAVKSSSLYTARSLPLTSMLPNCRAESITPPH